MRSPSPVFLVLMLVALQACHSSEGSEGPPNCGDEKTVSEPIINGDPFWDPTVVDLNEYSALAVGFLELGGVGGCTGTLIASRTVLTAAHCVYSRPSYVRFYTGNDFRTPAGVYTATSYQAHPYYAGRYVDYDLGIVQLGADPMDDGVLPIPVHLEPPVSLLGADIQAVGFGITSPGSHGNTMKWWTVLRVTAQIAAIFQVTGFDSNGTCSGDSGSPLLWNHPELGTMVFGALSSGDSSDCLGNSFYPRTTYPENASFIRTYLPEDPCGDETPEGRCDGHTAIWCEGTTVMSEECETWETCMPDEEGNYRCVVTDPCRGETWEGRCNDAGAAVWCEEDAILAHPCPDFGYWCGVNDEGLTRCLPPGPCQAEGLDWTGICTADGHARWCDDGEVKDRDCWKCDQDCGWAGDLLGNYCVDR